MSFLDRALRMGEGQKFKTYEQRVARIGGYEERDRAFHRRELREAADELRERARGGESLDDLLLECFALVREAGKRAMGMRHFDVQLIGGMVLHDGCDRRDEDRRGQDADRDARRRAQLAGRPRRPRGHRQRLPRPPRRDVDEADLRHARRHRRRPAEHAALRGEARRLRRRRHLRDQLRVRLRLPARQHGPDAGGEGPARRPRRSPRDGVAVPHASRSSTRSTTS